MKKKYRHYRLWMVYCAFMIVIMALMGFKSNHEEIYTDVYSVFVSGKDIYAAGSICTDGTSATNVPTLWKNGVAQKIGNMGNFNRATSVFVLGNDVYVAISETDSISDKQYDGNLNDIELESDELVEDIELSVSGEEFENSYNPKAILWKNGERHLLWKGSANSVYVADEDVYVVGEKDEQPVLWKNGNLQILASSGSAESVVVHGKDVYVAGYLGSIFNEEAVLWKNGEMTNLGRGLARSVFIANNDVYVAGTINRNTAALWKNGELWWSENTYTSNAYSMTMTEDGKIIISGDAWMPSSGWVAAVWINGSFYGVDDKMRNQAMSVVSDGKSVYVGGNGEGNLWSVWKYSGDLGYNSNMFIRIQQVSNEQLQYKKCPNGHYYRGNGCCPYCPSSQDGEKRMN